MKKTVVTILLVLPFVLMFLISFMAKIMSTYQYIYVDSVCFVDDDNACISDFIKLGLNETYDLDIKIFPELASNKNVTYSSLDENIVVVDQEGIVIAKQYGTTKVSVKTEDGNKRDELLIKVSDDAVSGIDIIEEKIEIDQKKWYNLNVIIYPSTAINKKVSWSSDNTSVATVDINGKVVGVEKGTATIIVTTDDGAFTDTCVVNVNELEEPFDLVEYEEGKAIYLLDNNYFDLSRIVVIHDETRVSIDDIVFKITYNPSNDSSKAYIEGKYLTIQENIVVRIQAEVEGIEYKPTILVVYAK